MDTRRTDVSILWAMSPTITSTESTKEAHDLGEAIDEAARRQDWPGVVEACQQALAHPCAPHAFYLADIWTGLAEAYVLQERYDEAISALYSAIAAGHRAWPHPEADIARLHLLAGRRGEADELFASLKHRMPEDLWLYLAAGLAYAPGDPERAVEWLTKGLELAMASNDPEGLIPRMLEARNDALAEMGGSPDALSARAAAFVETWEAPPLGTWTPPAWPDEESNVAEPVECEYCGWIPNPAEPEPTRGPVDPRAAGKAAGVAFFPREEWSRAVTQWPHLLEEMPGEHFAYVRELQARIQEFSESTGTRLIMVPISVGGLIGFCADNGDLNPGGGQARAEYAAALIKQGHGMAWPPGRNEECWCGSRRKYKACCGSVHHFP